MTTLEFIKEYRIDYSLLAKHLGISNGCFSEKMNGKRYAKFTEPQMDKLKQYLAELSLKINELCQ